MFYLAIDLITRGVRSNRFASGAGRHSWGVGTGFQETNEVGKTSGRERGLTETASLRAWVAG